MTDQDSPDSKLQGVGPVVCSALESAASNTQVCAQPSTLPALLAETTAAAVCVGPGMSAIPPLDALMHALTGTGQFYGFMVPVRGQIGFMFAERAMYNALAGMWRQQLASKRLTVFPPPTTTPPNFLQEEGFALIRGEQKRQLDTLVLILPPLIAKTSFSHRMLPALLEAVQGCSTNAVVVFQGLAPCDAAHVPHYFDATLMVAPSAPDYDYTSAYIVAPAAGTLLAAVAGLPTIENIRPGAEGQLDRNAYPCVSPDPLNREIARMHEAGRTYEVIGEQLGMNKTTVMRRIDSLPFANHGRRIKHA